MGASTQAKDGRRRRTAGLVIAAAGIAAVALASSAQAATVGLDGGNFDPAVPLTWKYQAGTGEPNDLSVNYVATSDNLTFSELGVVGVTTGSFPSGAPYRCTQLTVHSVRCHPGGFGIAVDLGDRNDRIRLSGPFGPNCTGGGTCDERWQVGGGSGNDLITASAATGSQGHGLSLSGDDGADVIDANNGVADSVSCGPGVDVARVDLKDGPRGFRDCETVSQAPVDELPTVKIRGRSLHLRTGHDGGRSIPVKLRCPESLHSGCKGGLVIRERTGSHTSDAVIGRKRYRKIRAGFNARIRVPVGAGVNSHINVRVVARELDPDGMPKLTLRTMPLDP